MGRFLVFLLVAMGCNTQPHGDVTGPCDDLCQELVETCGYAAYPTFDSCAQGCLYNETLGADVGGQATCVTEAACDTFEIVECEHDFGPNE